MNFNLTEAIEVLERTPRTLTSLLSGLADDWLSCNEGEGTWNLIEIIEHLLEAEKVNWLPRLNIILLKGKEEPFPPFDRFAHLQNANKLSIEQLLKEFQHLRTDNINTLRDLLDDKLELEKIFEKEGLHPDLGTVNVRELLSTWVVHDLAHMSQIVRVMSKRYSEDVGPWQQYLGILRK